MWKRPIITFFLWSNCNILLEIIKTWDSSRALTIGRDGGPFLQNRKCTNNWYHEINITTNLGGTSAVILWHFSNVSQPHEDNEKLYSQFHYLHLFTKIRKTYIKIRPTKNQDYALYGRGSHLYSKGSWFSQNFPEIKLSQFLWKI